MLMNELIFLVEEAPEGGYTARALGASIFTEADDVATLEENVRELSENAKRYPSGVIFGEPWVVVTLFAWLCVWVIPFWGLLFVAAKKSPFVLGLFATVSLVA